MRVQLAWTMLTEIMVTISGILLLKFAASLLGPTGFGEYALSRRAVGLLYLPLVMGLGIAAPRYIAIARAGAMSEFSEGAFATATLTVGLLPAFAVVLLLNLASVVGVDGAVRHDSARSARSIRQRSHSRASHCTAWCTQSIADDRRWDLPMRCSW